MKGLGTGIINLISLPFRVLQKAFSFLVKPIKFITEQIEFEKRHQIQRKKFFNAKRRSRKLNDEII
jgi:hypothetical protein